MGDGNPSTPHYTQRRMPDDQQAGSDPAAITVAQVMVADVLVVHSGDSIDDAVRLIVDSRITGVPVVDDEHHILGIVAESDVSVNAARPSMT